MKRWLKAASMLFYVAHCRKIEIDAHFHLRNEFPVNWEFLGIPKNSKLLNIVNISRLGIFENNWELFIVLFRIIGNSLESPRIPSCKIL